MKNLIKTLLIFAFIMPVTFLFAGCAKTYQIEYYVNGSWYKTVNVKSDESVFREPGPKQNGYIFDGWYLSETGDEKFDFSKYLDRNVKLYARYNMASYAVIYHNMDGATNNPNNKTSFDITTPTFILHTEGVTKTGYTFDGWYSDPLYVIDKTHINQGTHEDVHLYAKWNPNQYTITFVSNGGSEVASITAGYQTGINKPDNPTKEGYAFGGWYTDNNTFEHEYDFTTMPLNGITLYAKWQLVVHNEEELRNAVQLAGETVILGNDIELTTTLAFTNSITLDGAHTLSASSIFSGNPVLLIDNGHSDVVLTLKGITLDANLKARAIVVKSGKLVVDGATITRGKATNSYIGGVYITNAGQFEMTAGTISGNFNGNSAYQADGYLQYAADLWIGANAVGSLASITGGYVENIFVNANSYSSQNPGSFTLDGGVVDNIYVEYDSGFGGAFHYETGTINHLYVSTTTSGYAVEVTPVEGTDYIGGTVNNV